MRELPSELDTNSKNPHRFLESIRGLCMRVGQVTENTRRLLVEVRSPRVGCQDSLDTDQPIDIVDPNNSQSNSH